ncbi:hypothetical protein J5N97_027280 [Dioscorea zingiberensis]|uniref:Uncharacterized protein n=1 Tax=Dioscorea zingiberensis TaxID=325984 RepID=A0A9D5C3T1_9LILI|nr:hypothetical protein J5N97_027280 [Dioscorea zingiberensis]
MEVKEEEDGSLVEEREAKMVSLANPKASIKRKAWFLKPIASTMSDLLEAPLTPPPHYKATEVAEKAKFYVSPRGFQPQVTHQYVKFWKKLMVLFRELNAGKKRKRRLVCVFNGKKQRVGDSYDTKLSDWLFVKNRISSKKIKPLNIKDNGLCLTVEMRRAKKYFLKKKKLSISFLYDSKNFSDDCGQIEHGKLNSETKEERKGSRELSPSELSEIDDKENMNEEFTYSQAAMEELEAAFESQQAKIRSENSTRKVLELEMQIKKLKEEIAVIQARVMVLESLRDGKPNSVLP